MPGIAPNAQPGKQTIDSQNSTAGADAEIAISIRPIADDDDGGERGDGQVLQGASAPASAAARSTQRRPPVSCVFNRRLQRPASATTAADRESLEEACSQVRSAKTNHFLIRVDGRPQPAA
jgi:hypothetical protein